MLGEIARSLGSVPGKIHETASATSIVTRLTSRISASGMGAGPPLRRAWTKAAAQACWPLSWRQRFSFLKPGQPKHHQGLGAVTPAPPLPLSPNPSPARGEGRLAPPAPFFRLMKDRLRGLGAQDAFRPLQQLLWLGGRDALAVGVDGVRPEFLL